MREVCLECSISRKGMLQDKSLGGNGDNKPALRPIRNKLPKSIVQLLGDCKLVMSIGDVSSLREPVIDIPDMPDCILED